MSLYDGHIMKAFSQVISLQGIFMRMYNMKVQQLVK